MEKGFGSVFLATWLNGKRIVLGKSHHSVQSHALLFIVALKTLPGSKEFFKRSKLRLFIYDLI